MKHIENMAGTVEEQIKVYRPAIEILQDVEPICLKLLLEKNAQLFTYDPGRLCENEWEALNWAFIWHTTEEGFDLWMDCYCSESWQAALKYLGK